MKGQARTCVIIGAAICSLSIAGAQTSTIHSRSNLTVASSANMERIHPTTALTRGDKRFMAEIAQGNMAEVQFGILAQRQGGDWGRAYGKDMEREHNLALEELKKTARLYGVSLPTDIEAKAKHALARLGQYSGAAFDRAYRAMMIQDHRADLNAVQYEMNHGHNSDVRSYAVVMEPAVKMHLKMAVQQTTMMGPG